MNRQDFYRLARNRIRITQGTKLLPSAVDATGSTVNVLVSAGSAMAEELDSRSVGRFATQFAATARDEDLDRWVLERSFGKLPRKTASAAVFSVQLTRPAPQSGTAPSGAVPAGTEMLAAGIVWTLDAQVIFSDGQLGPLPATFTCATLGSAGNVGPESLSGFKTPGSLFDMTLLISPSGESDAAYASGGAERENDTTYRARFAAWDAGLDRNLDSLAAGARGVDGILYAEATENIDADGLPLGGVTLYVGDMNGRANAALIERVRARLRSFRLTGQRVDIKGTAPDMQSIQLSFAVREGASITQVRAQARAAVVAYVNGLLPGARLERAGIATALRGVVGVVFLPAYPYGVVSPANDVAPASTATLFRTRADLVTFA